MLTALLFLPMATIYGLWLALPKGIVVDFLVMLSSLAVVVALAALRPRHYPRTIVIFLSAAIAVTYLAWRVGNTLPVASVSAEFVFPAAILAAETFYIALMLLSFFIVLAPLDRPRAAAPRRETAPRVDVLVPTYDEDIEIVARTLKAATRLDYPSDRLGVVLLDDGGTAEKRADPDPAAAERATRRAEALRELCGLLGVTYLARERNTEAKAGNLNHGLAHTDGDLVVVLDADHAPLRNFLAETVGHFAEDDRLALVQTPPAFLNDEPIQRNIGFPDRLPAEHEMFHRLMQRGLDGWNAAMFTGSAAVMRRAALAEAGGFSGKSVTEDCETTIGFHQRGWTSRFVDRPLVWGLQPETLPSLVKQRSRWTSGMLQLLVRRFPLVQSGLTLPQRLCYLSSCLYWLFPLARLALVFAPLVYIWFDVKIFIANPDEVIVYGVPYVIMCVVVTNYLYGRYRWPFLSDVYEYVLSVFLARSVVSTLLRPGRPRFHVTEKGTTRRADGLSPLAPVYVVIFAVLLATAIWTGVRLATEEGNAILLVAVGTWNLFNLWIAAAALGAVVERRELRRTPRLAIERTARLLVDGADLAVDLVDASSGGVGARLRDGAHPAVRTGARGILFVPGEAGETDAPVEIEIVRLREEGAGFGARFAPADPRRLDAAARLTAASGVALDPVRGDVRAARARSVPVWAVAFAWLALANAGRALAMLLRAALAGRLRPAATVAAPAGARPTTRGAVAAVSALFAVAFAAAMLAPEHARAGDAAAGAATPAAAAEWTRPIPLGAGRDVLSGEWAVRRIPVFLSREEVIGARRLEVAAVSAVAALPSASRLDVFVNGVRVLSTPPAFGEPRTVATPIRPGLLVPGFNEVMITARHQHRVACTIEGTWELWTRLLPGETRIVMAPDARPAPSLDVMPSLAAASGAPSTLRLHVPADAAPAAISRRVRLASAVARLAHLAEPRVEVIRDGGTGPGLDLFVGTPPSGLSREAFPDAPGLSLLTRAGRPAGIALHGADALARGLALGRLETAAAERAAAGAPDGLAAHARAFGRVVAPGETVALSTLGVEDQRFAGRRFREAFDLVLPGDLLVTDSGNVVLDLAGRVAGGLSPESVLRIAVNGEWVRTVPLAAEDELSLDPVRLDLPLELFESGRNRIALEADLLKPADAACAPGTAAVERPRIELLGASTLAVPEAARVATVPNLAATFGHGMPYAGGRGPTNLHLVESGGGDLAAAATLAAVMNARGTHYTRFNLVLDAPADDGAGGVVVGRLAGLPGWARAGLGVEPAPTMLASADGDGAARLAAAGGAIRPEALAAPSAAPAVPDRGFGLGPDIDRLIARTARVLTAAAGGQPPRAFTVGELAIGQVAPRAPLLSDLAAALRPGTPPATWTIAAYDRPETLIDALGGGRVLSGAFLPRGDLYVLRDGREIAIRPADGATLVASGEASLANLRLVAGGWLSKRVGFAIVLFVGLTAALGLLIGRLLERRRRALLGA